MCPGWGKNDPFWHNESFFDYNNLTVFQISNKFIKQSLRKAVHKHIYRNIAIQKDTLMTVMQAKKVKVFGPRNYFAFPKTATQRTYLVF